MRFGIPDARLMHMRRVTMVLCSLWLVATLSGCRERVSLTESLMVPIERASHQAMATTERFTPTDDVADATRREQLWDRARDRGWDIGAPLEETEDERVPVAGFAADPVESEAVPEGADDPPSERGFESSELDDEPFEAAAGGAAAGLETAWDPDAPTDEELAEQDAWELAWQEHWDAQQAQLDQAWEERQRLAEELAATNASLSDLQAANERLRQEAELAALLGFFNAQRLLAVQQGLMLIGAGLETASPAQTGEPSR